jgi:acyl-coenzyme A thioesterase PaaI-like protein
MSTIVVPFRLGAGARAEHLQEFNRRAEIAWFGFSGQFVEPGEAEITFARMAQGALGGGGTQAVNGGVIAAGFDAAFVLAGLGHYDSEVVITLELSVKFLSLARADRPLAFRAHVVRSGRHFAFVEGRLGPQDGSGSPFAVASAMVAPAG